jgi:hypothetical protein
MVAGLYSNRLRQGMMLQADPTIIYPITKGKPLGRRIRQSEIQAVNGYNTYTMVGLPKGPITNPGRASIAAVLNPAKTDRRSTWWPTAPAGTPLPRRWPSITPTSKSGSPSAVRAARCDPAPCAVNCNGAVACTAAGVGRWLAQNALSG